MNGMSATGGLYIDENSKASTKTWVVEKPNGQICLNSRDRTSGFVAAPRTQPWNDFTIQTAGQNIMQGIINTVKLQEIRLPYAIPNVNDRTNFFGLYVYQNTTPGLLSNPVQFFGKITVPNGWYNGTELAAAVNSALTTAFTANPLEKPTLAYDDVSNTFTFTAASQTGITITPYDPVTGSGANAPAYSKSLLSIMGFLQFYGSPVGTTTEIVSQWASMTYTQYLDIASNTLTTYQDLADTSTFELIRRQIICRVYIADEISVGGDPPGTRPFTIHRQFVNPKSLKWNGKDSVSRIDMQVYDDAGEPAYIPPQGLPDFQITFTVAE